MAMKLQFGEEHYRIVGSSKEGELVVYGEPAELSEAGIDYMALACEGEDGEIVSGLANEEWIISYKSVSGVVTEDVDFQIDDDGGGDGEATVVVAGDDDDDDDDEDEDETAGGEGEKD